MSGRLRNSRRPVPVAGRRGSGFVAPPLARARRRLPVDRGAAAVEMALIMPILLLLVFGIIDFGRLLNAQVTVTEAAREGARAEALGADPVVRANSASSNLGTVVVTTDKACPALPDTTKDAQITVTYSFDFVTPVGALAGIFGGGGFGGPIDVKGKGVMPCMQ